MSPKDRKSVGPKEKNKMVKSKRGVGHELSTMNHELFKMSN